MEGNILFIAEENIRYDIRLEFTRGSNLYNVYCENKLIGENIQSIVPFYSIEEMNIAVRPNQYSGREYSELYTPYVLIDNVRVYTEGKIYPQKYSAQKKGSMPNVTIPEENKTTGLRVFVNDTEISFFNKPVEKGKTIYIDLEQFSKCVAMTLKEDKSNNTFSFYNEKVTVNAKIGSKKLKVNNIECSLAYSPEKINGTICVTPNFLSEALNSKIWWDEEANMLVITTGKRKNDNILRVIGGDLYMNGEPYYEISFNKSDLFQQILAFYVENSQYPNSQETIENAETALKQLNEMGLESIRVYAYSNDYPMLMYDNKSREIYFKAMDKMFDLLDKYNIKAVVSLGLTEDFLLKKEYVDSMGWIKGDETFVDLVSNSKSESRKNVYDYIEMLITRYKDRKSILMWEIDNGANLECDNGEIIKEVRYSLLQLADFYGACADAIRKYDEHHIISSGDSMLLNNQWNSFKSVMNGESYSESIDNVNERLSALTLLNKKLDVVSIHSNSILFADSLNEKNDSENVLKNDFQLLKREAERLNKALYNGETYCSLAFENEDFYNDTQIFLDSIVSSKVQLSYWWSFRNDSINFKDNYVYTISEGKLLDLICNANELLQSTYCKNKAENENTTDSWDDFSFEVIDVNKVISGNTFTEEASLRSKLHRLVILTGMMFVSAGILVVVLTREKIKRKRKDEVVW